MKLLLQFHLSCAASSPLTEQITNWVDASNTRNKTRVKMELVSCIMRIATPLIVM